MWEPGIKEKKGEAIYITKAWQKDQNNQNDQLL
jgi:hypothetical protein